MKTTPCPYTESSLKNAWKKGYEGQEANFTSVVESKAYQLGQKAHKRDTDAIPSGYYCYKMMGEIVNGSMPIKTCPYFSYEDREVELDSGVKEVERVAICGFLKQTQEAEDEYSFMIMDQVKECGEKYD